MSVVGNVRESTGTRGVGVVGESTDGRAGLLYSSNTAAYIFQPGGRHASRRVVQPIDRTRTLRSSSAGPPSIIGQSIDHIWAAVPPRASNGDHPTVQSCSLIDW